jgi:hypothetical protein
MPLAFSLLDQTPDAKLEIHETSALQNFRHLFQHFADNLLRADALGIGL